MEKLVKHTKTAAEGRMPFDGGLLLPNCIPTSTRQSFWPLRRYPLC